MLRFDKHRHRPQLNSDRVPLDRSCTIAEAARILNTSIHKVRRTLLIAMKEGPDALRHTKWGKGRSQERLEFTQEQKNWATAPKTLRE